jgi:prevent-host-death family protein
LAFVIQPILTALAGSRTALYRSSMTETKGAEEARNTLPSLLERAEKGISTVISRHGRRVAAIVPIEVYDAIERSQQRSLLSLVGTGRGLWGEDSSRTIRELRDEWTR